MARTTWTSPRMRTLGALCDTFVPAVEPPGAARVPAFWARRASDLDVPAALTDLLDVQLSAEDRAGICSLLGLLRATGFASLSQGGRERVVRGLSAASADAARGVDALRALTMMLFYAEPGPDGDNPNWSCLGYPGPPDTPANDGPSLAPLRITDETVLHADVCVVGSGSGGGVVAGALADAGRKVVVLEAGGHHEDVDFTPYEVPAFQRLYWRGGLAPTEEGNVTLLAGATLGGGSTVNWTNCVLPPASVRAEWADHGLVDLPGADFDAHLDAVLTRISATADASDLSGPNARLAEGADALGWSSVRARRNTDLSTYDPASAGHLGFGDRTGSKQGTLKTYLRDAVAGGADVVVRCTARRVIVENGRAAGVEAVAERADGTRVPLTVRCRDVVVACGALETPALLLRSGIGGPAVGAHLRLHPVPALIGFYPEDQRGWWGAPQTTVVDEFRDISDGYGFLVETPHYGLGVAAATLPWRSGRDHKLLMGRSADIATFIAVTRDRGSGRVSIDDGGEAVVHYPLDDELDVAHLSRAVDVMAELHRAAGAEAILDTHPRRELWSRNRGDDFAAFLHRLQRLPLGGRGRRLFSAHQMGTARMGTDPGASVATPEGELHDTPGVWIGDTSAFPTAVGSNPMVTCMALARRTAHALLSR